jgi:hypothetical protein
MNRREVNECTEKMKDKFEIEAGIKPKGTTKNMRSQIKSPETCGFRTII